MTKKQKRIAIDLDGTLLQHNGWRLGQKEGKLGKPLPGAIRAVRTLLGKGWRVIVFTARRKRRGLSKKLQEMGFPRLKVTNIKSPLFEIFLDDRAQRFHPDIWEMSPKDLVRKLEDLRKPWWAQK